MFAQTTHQRVGTFDKDCIPCIHVSWPLLFVVAGTSTKTTFVEVWKWGRELERLHARIAHHFARPEPRRRALAYLKGIVSSVERKNGWQLAEHAGESRPDGMQRLLNSAVWDADLVRDDLRAYILERLGDSHAVLVIDETSFRKRGQK